MATLKRLSQHPNVEFVDDERSIGNGLIVTLVEGLAFEADPDCGVRGFDTIAEAYRETRNAVKNLGRSG